MQSRTISRRSLARVPALALAFALSLAGARAVHADLAYSPDVTVDLDGTIVTDEQVAEDDFAAVIALANLGTLPAAAEVDAYAQAGSDHLFSLDTTVQLAGGLTVTPSDVIRYDGSTYSLEFDALAEGVPTGSNVDAVSIDGSGLVISFDTTVDLGSGIVAADEDLISFSGGVFVLLFDGSAAGVDPALDLDAVGLATGGALWVSFDQAGSVGGIVFDDDDLVLYTGSTWAKVGDVSGSYAAFGPADVVAVPEPHIGLGLGLGGMMVAALARRRSIRAGLVLER